MAWHLQKVDATPSQLLFVNTAEVPADEWEAHLLSGGKKNQKVNNEGWFPPATGLRRLFNLLLLEQIDFLPVNNSFTDVVGWSC